MGQNRITKDIYCTCRYGFDAEVVQSLAKWKRLMLKRYALSPGEGLFCESTSIRKGYKGDVTHSNICDQWAPCLLPCLLHLADARTSCTLNFELVTKHMQLLAALVPASGAFLDAIVSLSEGSILTP